MAAGDDQALDHVLELADVARPRIVAERLEGVGLDALDQVAVGGGEARQEVLDQAGDVFLALAQRRHPEVDDVQAVVEVLAELALGDEVLQVAVGGGDDADVDAAPGALGADLLQLAGFEEAEQQPLHAQRHLADFVEEDGAFVGGLELARLVAIGAGEAALHVTEELGFEQRLGQAGAVDRDEGALARGDCWCGWRERRAPCRRRSRR